MPAGLGLAVSLAPPVVASSLAWRVVPAPGRAAVTEASPTPYQPAPKPIPVVAAVNPPAPNPPAKSPAPSSPAPSPPANHSDLRDSLRIPPLVTTRKPWPAPSLSPGVPSSFIANWGDVFVGVSAATAGKQRDSTADGSWSAGFGLGDAAKAVAIEFSGGCGSIKDFCVNGSFDVKLGRLLINQPKGRLAISGAWQNFAQWGNEGRQDNTYYGGFSYALPLDPNNKAFERTLMFSAGVGNSRYATYSATDSQNQIGGFGSIGIELSPAVGLSAGWSGRGANAQLSFTPFREAPISINLLGADLFNQSPAGTVGVLSVSWGNNFRTPSFD